MQPPDLLFFVVLHSFYISRYHFPQIFRTSFNIIWKKYFSTNSLIELEQSNSVIKTELVAYVGSWWESKHSNVKIWHFCFYLFK